MSGREVREVAAMREVREVAAVREMRKVREVREEGGASGDTAHTGR